MQGSPEIIEFLSEAPAAEVTAIQMCLQAQLND